MYIEYVIQRIYLRVKHEDQVMNVKIFDDLLKCKKDIPLNLII